MINTLTQPEFRLQIFRYNGNIYDVEKSNKQQVQKIIQDLPNPNQCDFYNGAKKPQIRLNNKHEHSERCYWRDDEKMKTFYQYQRYCMANLYSRVKKGDKNSLLATAHAICYINRDIITLDGIKMWLRDMNDTRCEVPFKTAVLRQIANKAYENREKEPKFKYKYKYLFRKELKLTFKEKMILIGQSKITKHTKDFHEALDNWDVNELYTREKMAKKIGVKENTLGSWRTRYPEYYADADEKIAKLKEMYKQKQEEKNNQQEEPYIGDPIGKRDAETEAFQAFRDNCEDKNHEVHSKDYTKKNVGKRYLTYKQRGINHYYFKKFGESFWFDDRWQSDGERIVDVSTLEYDEERDLFYERVTD